MVIAEAIRTAMACEQPTAIVLVSATDIAPLPQSFLAEIRATASEAWYEIEFGPMHERDALKLLLSSNGRELGDDGRSLSSDEERIAMAKYLGYNAALLTAYTKMRQVENFSLRDEHTSSGIRSVSTVAERIAQMSVLLEPLADARKPEFLVLLIIACAHEGVTVEDLRRVFLCLTQCGWPYSWRSDTDAALSRKSQRLAIKECVDGSFSELVRSAASVAVVPRSPFARTESAAQLAAIPKLLYQGSRLSTC